MLKILMAALVIVASITLAGCGGSEEAVQTPTPTSGSLLTGVPKADIDGSRNSGKMERAAPNASPAVNADAAIRTAKSQQPNANVLQTVLIDYTNLVQPSPAPRLVWVVNFDPITVAPFPPGGCMTNCPREDQLRTDWFYVLIDANSGEFINSASATSVVTDTPTSAP